MTYAEQVKKFKKMIPIGIKSTFELINILKSKVDVEEISFKNFPYYNLQMLTNNATHCVQNMELQIKPDEMRFRIFRVIENEKSDKYNVGTTKDFIFVVTQVPLSMTTLEISRWSPATCRARSRLPASVITNP